MDKIKDKNNKPESTDEKKENAVPDAGRKELDLEYPCLWIYKIIGIDQQKMESAVAEIIQDRSFKISFSRRSEKARYISLNVELVVESEAHRLDLYSALTANQAIKLVL